MNINSSKTRVNRSLIHLLFVLLLITTGPVFAEITYTFHLDGVDQWLRDQIEGGVHEAVALYNQYGSFNKHLNISYTDWPGVTAEANFNGDIKFGSLRGTRVTLHEMAHTMGCGTYWDWGNHMIGGAWNGVYATETLRQFDGGGAVLWGDNWHFWPYGLNYDNEDGDVNRFRHIRIVAGLIADMGFPSFLQEPTSQLSQLGGTAVFSVEAANANSYAWYKQDGAALANGGRISGVNTATLQITNVQPEDGGRYYCRINNELSSHSAGLAVPKHVSHLEFSGTTLDSIGTNHGGGIGAMTYTAGKIGQAIDLDGVTNAVVLPAGVADAADITVTAWVNWDGGGNWQRIFDFGNNTDQYLALLPKSGDNTLRLTIKNGSGEQFVDSLVLPTQQWVHVAARLNGNTATLYVNGSPVASNSNVTINPIDFAPNKNYIGDSQYGADPLFNGRIDEFHIYSYALTNAEIQSLYLGQANTPDPAVNTSGVPTQSCLTWQGGFAGEQAWQTYMGTSQTAVATATTASAEYVGVRYQPQLSTAMLSPSTTYYWRVDPLKPDGTAVKGTVWMFTTGSSTGQQTPKFAGHLLSKPPAVEGMAYSQSLSGDVTTASASSFQKLAGPDWISISTDGQITGIPPEGSAGQNTCMVRLTDADGWADEAMVSLVVQDTCSGMNGMSDLTRFAEHWLYIGPAFNPADLDQNLRVDLIDWSLFAADWNHVSEPGLVAAWTMNDAFGETIGDTLGHHPGTLQNMNTSWRPLETIVGETGSCLAFDGVDDSAVMTGFKGITGGATRTCTAWVKTPSVSGYILTWGGNTDGRWWVIRVNEGGQLRAQVQGGNIIGSTPINDDVWHHIAVVVTDDGTPDIAEAKLYVDGQRETISAVVDEPIDTAASEDVRIGAYLSGVTVPYFRGMIDEVRIYDRALDDTEIMTMARARTVAYWRFEEGPLDAPVTHGGAGNGIYYPGALDSSGHGNHLSVFAEGWAGFAYGDNVSGSLLKTGDDNLFCVQNTGYDPAMSTGSEAMRTMTPAAWTIEVSFKQENGIHRTLVGRDSYGTIAASPALAALYLQVTPSDAVTIAFSDVTGYWHAAQSADGLIQGFDFPDAVQGHWYHLAAVSDGTWLSLYLADADTDSGYQLVAQTDLSQSGSVNTALSAGAGSGSDWQAGTWTVGRGLYNGIHTDRARGFIDEVRISRQALTPSQFLYTLP